MKKLLVIAIVVTAVSVSQAGFIVQPTGLAWDTSDGWQQQNPQNGYNGSGLSDASLVENGDAIPTAWPTHEAWGNGGLADITDVATRALKAGVSGPVSRTLTIDLDDTYDVSGIVLWNWSSQWNGAWSQNRGVYSAEVEYSTDGGTTWATGETVYFDQVAEVTSIVPEIETFTGGAVTANKIRLNMVGLGASTFIGFGEIRLTAVPEPASMLLLGLGGLLLRKKRN